MRIALGSFLLSINGEDELLDSIFAGWKNEKEVSDTFQESIKIQLISSDYNDLNKPEGWNAESEGAHQKTYYSCDGITYFSLEYDIPVDAIRVCFNGKNTIYAKMGIQYAIMLALHDHCIGLHGVTLVIRNEIVILSAPSGTGKTTLSKLLESYSDAIVINGDFALLRPTEDGVIYEPTPFCGSSARSLNHRLKINRVVFLEQGKSNTWRELNGREALTLFLSNSFVPEWNGAFEKNVTDNIINCIEALKVNNFAFLPVKEAALCFEKQLDNYDD